jgi:hypothetical protein
MFLLLEKIVRILSADENHTTTVHSYPMKHGARSDVRTSSTDRRRNPSVSLVSDS